MLDNSSISLKNSPTQRYLLYDARNDYKSSYLNNSVWDNNFFGFSWGCSLSFPSFNNCFWASAGYTAGIGIANIAGNLINKWLSGGENNMNFSQYYGCGGAGAYPFMC